MFCLKNYMGKGLQLNFLINELSKKELIKAHL